MDPFETLAPDPALPAATGSGVRAVGASVVAMTAVTLPVFLVGTLAVQIEPSLHFGATILGLVVGCSYAASSGVSIPSGLLADRFGGGRTLRLASAGTAISLVLVATVVQSWAALLLALVLAGAASALAQTSSNLFLSRRVTAGRQGLAFGIKQAAVPLAFLLGGAAVPALALTVGWRWAFAGAAVLAVLGALVIPASRRHPGHRERERQRREAVRPEPALPLVVLGLAFGLGLMACSSLGAFLVSAAVRAGISSGGAGLVAVAASAAGVAVRVLVGLQADRRGGRHFPIVAAMMVTGAGGFALLVAASALRLPLLYVPGAVIAFGIGWGWNGLFNFALVRSHPAAPARATGITQTGGRLGSMIGPLIFGVLVDHLGYSGAWVSAMVEAVLGAMLMVAGRQLLLARLERERQASQPVSSS